MNILREFVSEEQRYFNFNIGGVQASALSGFIAGAIVAFFALLILLNLA